MQAKAAAADSNAAVAPSSGDNMSLSFFCFYDSTPGNDGVQHELDLFLSDSARDISPSLSTCKGSVCFEEH